MQTVNTDYHVIIHNEDQGVKIHADLPEQFGLSLSSNYEASENLASNLIPFGDIGSRALGTDLVFQPFTKLIYRGTQPLEFSLSILFDAENNSKEDVFNKAAQLSSLVLPGQSNVSKNILESPIPVRFDSSVNRTTIAIGRMFFFDSIVIQSATPNFEIRLDKTGMPIAGAIELACTTEFVVSKEDWIEICDAGGMGSIADGTNIGGGNINYGPAGKVVDTALDFFNSTDALLDRIMRGNTGLAQASLEEQGLRNPESAGIETAQANTRDTNTDESL